MSKPISARARAAPKRSRHAKPPKTLLRPLLPAETRRLRSSLIDARQALDAAAPAAVRRSAEAYIEALATAHDADVIELSAAARATAPRKSARSRKRSPHGGMRAPISSKRTTAARRDAVSVPQFRVRQRGRRT